MTSTTITRLCDSAVVCRRSIASVAICTAVWKPNVKSVPARSLSIVLGTPTTLMPVLGQLAGDAQRVLAADRDQRVDAEPLEAAWTRSSPFSSLKTFVRDVPRIVPPRCRMPRVRLVGQRHRVAESTPAQPYRKPDELVAVRVDPLAHDRADDGVESGAVAAPGEQTDASHSAAD